MKVLGIINHLISILFGIVQFILGLRIILRFFGASETASFVEWIYGISEPLLRPFKGTFSNKVLDETYVIEFSSIFALLIYTMIGYMLTALVVGFDRKWNKK
ncbi:YggT family protein [Tenuibacillus multivorans]|uniref:YGGT family protein n=1 Tax=Tenuibacillus multivorans TaxID=237069 RepID=A0A1H0B628_9BACI|nr:YggT family protein [Tenuibacillus multivorans]GEL78629.1 hypothetical protein TMU01_28640 [Tenuibacillus multivorans]SDN41117.1 YGGT family protein [Tenuibacillus multivorans]